ncbi:MAG TPA: RNA polymerase sigma factor [Pararhizobium sp.]|nr:RNA polymerase sigma factor [Pararhizobium sp.]
MEAIRTAERQRNCDGLDDGALVTLARRGEEAAVRAIIKRHNRRLFRTARAVVRDDFEAEDVVQEAYVKAFTHLDSFRGDSTLSTWLTRIALNEALARLRRRRPTVGLDHPDVETDEADGHVLSFPSRPADPEAETARSQIHALLERAVDALPEHFRIVFVLREIEALSTEETAEQLGIRPETVKTRLHRARRLMRTAIEREFSDALSGAFPFDGARCAHMADRVLARLREKNAG